MKILMKKRSFVKVEMAGLLGVKVPCLMPNRVKGVTPTFSNLGILLKIDVKIVLCWGNCCQFGEQFQYCPNQPILPNLPRRLKTHIAFLMFPILDTNLWFGPNLKE